MDVVDRIGAVKTGSKDGMDDLPLEPVIIKNVTEKRPSGAPEGTDRRAAGAGRPK